MKDIALRAMWFFAGATVACIGIAHAPIESCSATAADHWLANSIGLGVSSVIAIGLGFWEGWKSEWNG